MPTLNLTTDGQINERAAHIATDNTKLSGAISAPPPARNRAWKAPNTLPASLAHEADKPIYVLWRYGSTPNGKGKYPKIPYSPHKVSAPDKRRGYTYKSAKTDEPASWGTFGECQAAARDWRGWFDGIGRVLQPGEVGIDYDDCIAGGETAPRVLVDLHEASGYKERSVSRSGWHIIALGQVAEAIKTDEVEIYPGGTGRFFVLTGDEHEASSRPAASQALINRLVKEHGSARAAAGGALRQPETVALTPELASQVAEASKRLPMLLEGLRSNMTVQLSALLLRGKYPPHVKDTSASGARAVVVAQLQRAPKKYTDAEVYALAREIWRRRAYEGAIAGKETELAADCWRLMAKYRPGAPAAAPAKRTYNPAPAPLAYLERLVDEAAGGAVLLNRHERAALAGVPRATAQRLEGQLVTQGLAELEVYSLSGQGCKGRRGMLRITPEGLRALGRQDESVILETSAPDELVTHSAPESAKPAIEAQENTRVSVEPPAAPAATNPRVLSTPEAVAPPIDEPAAAPATLAELVREAIDAYGTSYQFGQVKPLERVKAYVLGNAGGRTWPTAAIEAIYRRILEERERERQRAERARLEALEDTKELKALRKAAENKIRLGLSPKPERKPLEEPERYAERVKRWCVARRQLPHWQALHAIVVRRLEALRPAEKIAAAAPLVVKPAPVVSFLALVDEAPLPSTRAELWPMLERLCAARGVETPTECLTLEELAERVERLRQVAITA